ncbi:GLPGLI family protein [Chryseobacterium scophthalmum]|uniref:GLPGLI family protein n=1 Tax=Chryseobacterium scophthalmum TaxID=59733 RepID=A0A1N6EDR3_9FLAO|nr:GLPGLI family protein [Chryseobacterium scophthalmum]SIN81146.1 GLPGLI family protein [Chryseobacterium scophthalmum]
MKNKIIVLLVFLVFIKNYSQKRFVYEYKFVPDVSKKDSVLTDYMNLDSDMKNSVFYSSFKNVSDSLRQEMASNKSIKANLPYYNPNLIYTITKNYSKNSVAYHIKDSGVKFKLTEIKPINWKILKETKTINNLKCQKATTDLYGRKWIAWFSPEIAIQDGPYKFNNLPGLIVKIEDTDKNHSFELTEIKNIKNLKLSNDYKNEKEITQKQLNQLFDDRAKNINSNIGEMFVQQNSVGIVMKDGNVIQLDKSTKNVEKELENAVKRTNNPIELKVE